MAPFSIYTMAPNIKYALKKKKKRKKGHENPNAPILSQQVFGYILYHIHMHLNIKLLIREILGAICTTGYYLK